MLLSTAISVIGMTATPALAKFHAASYPVKIHALSLEAEKFASGAATVTCQVNHYFSTGQAGADSEQVKVKPLFLECKTKPLIGNEAASTVTNPGGCVYNFHQEGAVKEGKAPGGVTLEGCASPGIEVVTNVGGCILFITNQGPLTGLTYTNKETAGVKHVDVKANVAGIKFTTNGSCFGITSGTATYEGGALTLAENGSGGAVSIEVV
jgi:hypothetical protein